MIARDSEFRAYRGIRGPGRNLLLVAAALVVFVVVAALRQQAQAVTYTVNSTDDVDDAVCDVSHSPLMVATASCAWSGAWGHRRICAGS